MTSQNKTLAQDFNEAMTLIRCERLIEACDVVLDARLTTEDDRGIAAGQVFATIYAARKQEFFLLARIPGANEGMRLWSELGRLAAKTQHAKNREAALVDTLTRDPAFRDLARALFGPGALLRGEREELARFVGLVYVAGLLDGGVI